MVNNRPKIASLAENELAKLLIESFFKTGKIVDLAPQKLKILLDEIYKKQGWMFIDIFCDAFSCYAACELPEVEKIRPEVSSLFIGKVMKAFNRKWSEKKQSTNSAGKTFAPLTGEEKFDLFLRHTLFYCSLPENPDWVCIYEYLTASNKLKQEENWELFSYAKKWKQASIALSEWTYRSYEL